MSYKFECGWAQEISQMSTGYKKAIALIDLAMAIRMYGERAPGGKENWRDWDVVAEEFLREVKGLGHE